MIKVSVLYPNGEGRTFDHDYYRDRHLPMLADLVGDALKGYHIDRGVSGGGPDVPPPFLAACHLLFETVEAYDARFGPHAREIMADIPNYTNTRPTLLISEIVK
jgi:uncharacterized protein (TIGR02118 family)